MSAKKFSIRRALPALLCSGLVMGTVPAAIVEAQTNPGFSLIWGGRDSQPSKQLGYVLQYGTPKHLRDRWRLKLGRNDLAMSVIRVTTPDYFNGKFNEKRVELREAPKSRILNLSKGKKIPISSVTVDNKSGFIEIIPETPIPAGKRAELVLSNVKNPNAGMYWLKCSMVAPGDVPLPRQCGTWVMSFSRS
ncbi:MAG: DUF2808 domain-containing protein [Cyanobacteria bacterium P01_F01_bin.42]